MSEHELAEMDATAQAELVRSGEASPAELVDAAIERAERDQPGGQRDHPHLLRAGARAGRRRSPRRSLPRRAVPAQGPGRGPRRPARAPGDAGAEGGGFPPTGGHVPRRTLPRRRLRHDRQDQHPRARNPADDRAGRLRRHPQPLEPRAHAGRLQRRLGRPRSPPGSSRSRMPTTAAARSGSRPATTAWSG